MNHRSARAHVPNLEDQLHQVECALKALDIIALDIVEGHFRHDISGQALIYIVEHLDADITAIKAGLERHANAAPEARPANVWTIACPWSNDTKGQVEDAA